MRGVLGLNWSGVLEILYRFLYISWNGDVQYACLVVPVKCDANVETTCTTMDDLIFLLKCMYEVQCVLLSLVFDYKVVEH